MNELDTKNLQDISDYLHGNERQIQNNENLQKISEIMYFWKETGGHGQLEYQRKIFEEVEWAKSMRFYQFVVLFIIAISVAVIAFKI